MTPAFGFKISTVVLLVLMKSTSIRAPSSNSRPQKTLRIVGSFMQRIFDEQQATTARLESRQRSSATNPPLHRRWPWRQFIHCKDSGPRLDLRACLRSTVTMPHKRNHHTSTGPDYYIGACNMVCWYLPADGQHPRHMLRYVSKVPQLAVGFLAEID
jgi:hypothetical protein